MEAIRKHQLFKISREYDTQLKRLYPVPGLQTPFGSAYATVDAGTRSQPHQHHEHETFVILQGQGLFVQDGHKERVASGDVLYIKPFSEHYLEADAACDIQFMSIWWEPQNLAEQPSSTHHLIFTPPPTPNGDLHLGHICGPYIAADVIRRQLQRKGKNAHLVVGTDKSQSYVDLKARQRAQPTQGLFEHYSQSIMQTFRHAGMAFDSVYDCDAKGHAPFVHDFIHRLQERGVLHHQTHDYAWCEHCNLEVFDAFARGECPSCAQPSNGCVCEDCGSPNNSYDLDRLHCMLCGNTPQLKSQTKAVLNLHACREHFAQAGLQIDAPPRLATYLRHQELQPQRDYVVSFTGEWGIPAQAPALAGQTYLAWIEMAAGYLAALYRGVFDQEPDSTEQAIDRLNQADVEVIHLMGFDNSFYYAYLYPRLFAALGLKQLKITFVVNEFLLLEQSKFSTSRNHAIWAKDVFTDPVDTDWYRFYLSLKRPEAQRENYRHEEFEQFRQDLGERLQALASTHRQRLASFAADLDLQQGGAWKRLHQEYGRSFEQLRQQLDNALSAPCGYSVKQFTTTLLQLVDSLVRFQHLTQEHYTAQAAVEQHHTSLYLESAAMLGLRQHLACLMPTATAQLLG